MKRQIVRTLAALLVLGFSTGSLADVAYRPEANGAKAFVNNVSSAEIAVFPTIVRTPYLSRFSTESQRQVIAFLQTNNLGNGKAANLQFYLGGLQARSQFEMFQNSMQEISKQLAGYEGQADYTMVIEVVFPPVMSGLTQVFGIHVYLLDAKRDNAFSFLMNSHHRAFVDAKLTSWKDTAASKEELAIKSTRVALDALKHLIEELTACLRQAPPIEAVTPQAGVLLDFDFELPTGTDNYGVPMGFSTFSGGNSSVSVSTTTDYPPRPDAPDGNKVLRLDVDVSSWAGVAHTFTNDAADRWLTQDWSDFEGFSFLLFGNDSGTVLFVDVLDNRGLCSTSDDAERYVYGLVDDFSGWRRIMVRFADMVRKEIRNDAPNDGLGLAGVHGWAFGTGKTDGPVSFYIDDFELWRTATEVMTERVGMFEEKRLDDSSSTLIFKIDDSDKYVVEKTTDLICACVDLTVERGFRFFKMDRQATLADGRGSFRLKFYNLVPEGIQVVDLQDPAAALQEVESADYAIDAIKFGAYCRLFEADENRDSGRTQ